MRHVDIASKGEIQMFRRRGLIQYYRRRREAARVRDQYARLGEVVLLVNRELSWELAFHADRVSGPEWDRLVKNRTGLPLATPQERAKAITAMVMKELPEHVRQCLDEFCGIDVDVPGMYGWWLSIMIEADGLGNYLPLLALWSGRSVAEVQQDKQAAIRAMVEQPDALFGHIRQHGYEPDELGLYFAVSLEGVGAAHLALPPRLAQYVAEGAVWGQPPSDIPTPTTVKPGID